MTAKTVLVVEDDPDLQEVLRLTFEREGFRVVQAEGGARALEYARAAVPDVVVLDLMLPEMDGLEVCRRLRADPALRRIPVLMLTAKGEETDVVIGLGVGADDYLAKPARPRELVARIHALLRRARAERGAGDDAGGDAEAIRVGPLVVDPVRFEVRDDAGSVFRLTRTEFAVLHALARHPGRVYRRSELIDRAIGRDAVVTERTIDAHVKAVRRKLGAYGDLVETVRGVGYRLGDRTEGGSA